MLPWWGSILGAVALLYSLPRIAGLLRRGASEQGDPEGGIVVFAESLRWAGIFWGRKSANHALRQAGFKGRFLFWKWDPTWRAVLILPTIASPRFLEFQSLRLARKLLQLRRDHPQAKLHLMGYSCGGFLAVRALELLAGRVQVESCVLLAAAFSPWRDLRPAAKSCRGRIVMNHSCLDVVVGVGTVLTGTADRIHCPSVGAIGYKGPRCDRLRDLAWKPAWIRHGHWGGHFSAPARDHLRQDILPLTCLAAKADSASSTAGICPCHFDQPS